MVKINRKTRKIKRTKKFNRKQRGGELSKEEEDAKNWLCLYFTNLKVNPGNNISSGTRLQRIEKIFNDGTKRNNDKIYKQSFGEENGPMIFKNLRILNCNNSECFNRLYYKTLIESAFIKLDEMTKCLDLFFGKNNIFQIDDLIIIILFMLLYTNSSNYIGELFQNQLIDILIKHKTNNDEYLKAPITDIIIKILKSLLNNNNIHINSQTINNNDEETNNDSIKPLFMTNYSIVNLLKPAHIYSNYETDLQKFAKKFSEIYNFETNRLKHDLNNYNIIIKNAKHLFDNDFPKTLTHRHNSPAPAPVPAPAPAPAPEPAPAPAPAPDNNSTKKRGLITRFISALTRRRKTKVITKSRKSSKSSKSNDKERNIDHIWYKDWPDKGVPKKIFEFQLFCEKLKKDIEINKKGTTLIHCSAGIGRTGTLYIILYIMFDLSIEKCNDFNIKYENKYKDKSIKHIVKYIIDTILNSRKKRAHMVQTSDQLQFILDIFDINISNEININKEFKALNIASAENNYTTKVGVNCKDFNRYENILPFDDSRVKLLPVSKSGDLETCENYVNASYMNSFANSFKVIASDCPNSNNVLNFKRMLKQEQVTIIVMLTGLIEKEKEKEKKKCNDYTNYVLTNIIELDIAKKNSVMNVDSICKTILKLQKSKDNKDLELVKQSKSDTENYFTESEMNSIAVEYNKSLNI